MSGTRFDQLRISNTLANAGLESYTDGTLGIQAIRVAVGLGLSRDSTGIIVNGAAASMKAPCRLRQSSNVTLSGGAPNTVDGVSVNLGDRILVDGQTTASEDGIYEVTTVGTGSDGTWSRTVDAPTGQDAAGWFIQVLEGTLENLYRVDADLGGAVIGTDGWDLGIFSGSTATPGLGLVAGAGTDLDVNPGDGIAIASDRVVAQVSTAVSLQQYGGLVRTRNADGSAAGAANAGYLAVATDNSTLNVTAGNLVAVADSGITETQLNASVAGAGLTGGGGSSLAVGAGNGITVNANDIAVDPDSETGGNIQPVNLTSNGVGLDVSAIAGTGIEADGSANLRLATQGNGIAGGGGTTLSVDPDTGISVSATGVAIDTDSTVTFASPVAWTFPNGTTAEGLFVTGTPVDANHVVNKTYVDNAVTGFSWRPPASVLAYLGTRTVTQINALTPTEGDAVVAGDAGTPSAGTSDALTAGDIAEFDGTSWKIIVTNSGGFPPNGTRAVVAYPSSETLYSPLTDGADEGKIAQWDGSSLTPALTTPTDGDAILVIGENSVNENAAYVYDGSVPSGQWVQFSGAGQINAGTGLTKSGNTINVNNTAVVHTNPTIITNTDSIEVRYEAAGAGTGGLTDTTNGLAVSAGDSITLTANGVAVQAATASGAQQYGGLVVNRTSNGTGTAAAGDGYIAVATDNSTLEVNSSNQIAVRNDGVTEAKLGFSFQEEVFAASAFTLSSGNYVVSLANPAIATFKTYYFNECYRNGVADLTNTGSTDPATATEYRVTTTELQIGADITATGDVYRVRYLSTATS